MKNCTGIYPRTPGRRKKEMFHFTTNPQMYPDEMIFEKVRGADVRRMQLWKFFLCRLELSALLNVTCCHASGPTPG